MIIVNLIFNCLDFSCKFGGLDAVYRHFLQSANRPIKKMEEILYLVVVAGGSKQNNTNRLLLKNFSSLNEFAFFYCYYYFKRTIFGYLKVTGRVVSERDHQ